MPAVDYAPNTPRWTDLGTSDLEAAKRFYGELFGWRAESMSMEEAGGYTIFHQGDKSICGAGPLMREGQPTAWMTYVYVDDLDATALAVGEAGGSSLVPPMDVMEVGRMAVFMDSTGAVVAAWQPKLHTGADLFNEPNAMCWNELASRDVEASKQFYKAAFGWEGTTEPFGPTTYTEFKAGGATVAGMREMGPQEPAEVPPHWLVYFAVADCDAIAAKVRELGGRVLSEPMTIPPGRFAVLSDPQGGMFAVIAMGHSDGA
jgi:predicted enzyme related to lactoylglutathione lyase